MTDVCNRVPRFGASSYTLTIPERAGTSTSVGTISATDPDGDTVTYSITAGNDDGKFAIATSTGAITLMGTVDPDVLAFYALTVAASDGVAGTSTAAVGVAVLLDECSKRYRGAASAQQPQAGAGLLHAAGGKGCARRRRQSGLERRHSHQRLAGAEGTGKTIDDDVEAIARQIAEKIRSTAYRPV